MCVEITPTEKLNVRHWPSAQRLALVRLCNYLSLNTKLQKSADKFAKFESIRHISASFALLCKDCEILFRRYIFGAINSWKEIKQIVWLFWALTIERFLAI